ncbi:hypothetical protein [Arthrobacter sp. H14-L1]|uniref:hypothetical protein n=1 Tax=Arthrobacter sp. H14-L1 TaxID=2996697 RepID=UPI00226DF68D|nr:hypothetical protein [Arthrobacter sp. H14-L1]MCY0906137.1 hypothetical protein [Arthrobacter sp. H14-L1]
MGTYSPAELAYKLGYTEETRPGRVVRSYLREKYLNHPPGQRWVLDEGQTAEVLANVPPNAAP